MEFLSVENRTEHISSALLRLEEEELFGLCLRRVVDFQIITYSIERRTCKAFTIVSRSAHELINLTRLGELHVGFLVVSNLLRESCEVGHIGCVGTESVGSRLQEVEVGLCGVAHCAWMALRQQCVGFGQCFFSSRLSRCLKEMFRVSDFECIEQSCVGLQTEVEISETALCLWQPRHFAESQQARIELILGSSIVVATLRPETGLRTKQELLLAAHHSHGVHVVNFVNAVHVSVAVATNVGGVDLGLSGRHLQDVEIEREGGREDTGETFRHRCFDALGRRICHHDGLYSVRIFPMVDKFVPNYHIAAVFCLEPSAEGFNEPGLEFFNTTKTFVFNAVLALLVSTPNGGGAFIATKVYVAAGEHVNNVAEHTLQEIDHAVVAHVENVGADTFLSAHRVVLR